MSALHDAPSAEIQTRYIQRPWLPPNIRASTYLEHWLSDLKMVLPHRVLITLLCHFFLNASFSRAKATTEHVSGALEILINEWT